MVTAMRAAALAAAPSSIDAPQLFSIEPAVAVPDAPSAPPRDAAGDDIATPPCGDCARPDAFRYDLRRVCCGIRLALEYYAMHGADGVDQILTVVARYGGASQRSAVLRGVKQAIAAGTAGNGPGGA